MATVERVAERTEQVTLSEYGRNCFYYPDIEYAYQVGGTEYLGRVVAVEKANVWVPEVTAFGDPTPREPRWWLQLQPGAPITAYVNPANPAEAVLVKRASKARYSHHLALLTSGVLLLVVWLVLLVSA